MHPESFAWRSDALSTSNVVSIRWLGTAGLELTSGAFTLLIDPYVTRAPLWRTALCRLTPDTEAVRALVPRAQAIVVGHTHFDHVLDVPAIARVTGARVYGSRSLARLCRAQGVPEAQIDEVAGSVGGARKALERRAVGPFIIGFHRSEHSRLGFGRYVPFGGEVLAGPEGLMRAHHYGCGSVFAVTVEVAGKRIVHVGSAELGPDVPEQECDVAIVCATGWSMSRNFPERLVSTLHPRAILLVHWDNFFLPFDAGATPLPGLRFARLVDRLARAAPSAKIGTLPFFGSLSL